MKFRWLRWIPVILWCALIFHATASPAYTGKHTEQVVAEVLLSSPPAKVELINIVIRKSTHVLIFGTLALLVWWALPSASSSRVFGWREAGAWLLATAYGASDEWHQVFAPGRTPEVHDVLIDSAGALLAVAVPCLVRGTMHKRKGLAP